MMSFAWLGSQLKRQSRFEGFTMLRKSYLRLGISGERDAFAKPHAAAGIDGWLTVKWQLFDR